MISKKGGGGVTRLTLPDLLQASEAACSLPRSNSLAKMACIRSDYNKSIRDLLASSPKLLPKVSLQRIDTVLLDELIEVFVDEPVLALDALKL